MDVLSPEMIMEMMAGAKPGEGKDQAAPGWDYDTLTKFIENVGGDLGPMDALDDATLTKVLESVADKDPSVLADMVNTIQSDPDTDGIYDMSPDDLPPPLATLLRDSLYGAEKQPSIPDEVMKKLLGDEMAR